MSQISVRHDGRRIILPIVLLPPEPTTDLTSHPTSHPTDALLDTGATTSGITPKFVKLLGLQSLGKRPIGSASGESQADRYLFRIGLHADHADRAPSFPFVFEEVMGFGLTDSFQFGALIGMDIIRLCDLRVERSSICHLVFG